MLEAAYPDEIEVSTKDSFPLRFVLTFDDGAATMELQLPKGYPTTSNVEIVSYRSNEKARIDSVAQRVRESAQACLVDEMEGALACCGAAFEEWNEHEAQSATEEATTMVPAALVPTKDYNWMSGEPLLDRKSTFQAHVCTVRSEQEVFEALHSFIGNSSKLQRATHNMYAWRLKEEDTVLKHDNDDDGEHGAGSRLAQLLQGRKEENVLIVVSRWYGGIHLGPKRFAHITNVAREVLIKWHGEEDDDDEIASKKKTSKARGK